MGIRLATEFTEIKHYCESVGFVFIKHDRIIVSEWMLFGVAI
jgi:hypothetical protein